MQIKEVTLNVPLQYKAMQCTKENYAELRDWVAVETLGLLKVLDSVADGNYYLHNSKRNSCQLIIEGDWVLVQTSSTSGVYPTYLVVVDELFRKMFAESTANNEEREMCIADALQICDTGVPIRRKSWDATKCGASAFVMLLDVSMASHLPTRFRAAIQFDGRSREFTTEKQYLLVTPGFINEVEMNWYATPFSPTWRDIRANDWVVAYKTEE